MIGEYEFLYLFVLIPVYLNMLICAGVYVLFLSYLFFNLTLATIPFDNRVLQTSFVAFHPFGWAY